VVLKSNRLPENTAESASGFATYQSPRSALGRSAIWNPVPRRGSNVGLRLDAPIPSGLLIGRLGGTVRRWGTTSVAASWRWSGSRANYRRRRHAAARSRSPARWSTSGTRGSAAAPRCSFRRRSAARSRAGIRGYRSTARAVKLSANSTCARPTVTAVRRSKA